MSLYVPVVGGLGNQMFILATGIATALRNNLELRVPRLPFSDSCFEPRPVYWDTIFQQVKTMEPGAENDGMTNAEVLPEQLVPTALKVSSQSNRYILRGFFQSNIYFEDYKSQVLNTLVPPTIVEAARVEFGKILSSGASNRHTLGIHIRRGDYLKMTDTFDILCTQEYYIEALKSLYGNALLARKSFRDDLQIILFSEDKEFASILCGTLRSRYQLAKENVVMANIPQDYLEMVAMAQCKDLIIANSSFSWWGAYLQEGDGRVVAPSRWFKGKTVAEYGHLYCDRWMIV